MTRAEFDSWIEQHYTDLLKVARRRTNSDDEARDALQSAVASMLTSEIFMAAPLAYAWPRAVKFTTRVCDDHRSSRSSFRRLRDEQSEIAKTASGLHGRKKPSPRAE